MSTEERTILQGECSVITAISGRKSGESEQELTLSEEATRFWSRPGAGALGKLSVPSGYETKATAASKRGVRASSAKRAWIAAVREILRFPPTDMRGALGWGALAGLVLAVALVVAVRGTSLGTGGEVMAQPRSVEVRVWTKTEAGSPVSGARVWIGEQTGTTDAYGSYAVPHRRNPQSHLSDEVQVKVECPRGYVGHQARRAVRWTGAPSRPSDAEGRELTFFCEVELVELTLDLEVERGDARFRLGERDLGSSEGGRLRREVLVPAHSEQVLTAEPELGPKQKPPLRIVGRTRVFQVGEKPASEEHTVEFIWPRARSAGPKAVPYRL
jgi:hypothetical protein